MVKNKHIDFSKIADKYRKLRTTDIEPIRYIGRKLQKLPKLEGADIGCGAGRYDLLFFHYFGRNLFLHCIDTDKEMLIQLKDFLIKNKIKNFKTQKAYAEKLPLKNNSLNCMFAFNAIHHFNLLKFMKETKRILKSKGCLFIYTRLRSQNKKNIWGRHFPMFNEKETRLYELNELRNIIKKVPNLNLEAVKIFKYYRISSLQELLFKAKNRNYSTFHFYTKKEFEKSLEGFKQNLRRYFKDPNKIKWCNWNTLLVIRKK